MPRKSVVIKSKEQEEKEREMERLKEVCKPENCYVFANNNGTTAAAANSAHHRGFRSNVYIRGARPITGSSSSCSGGGFSNAYMGGRPTTGLGAMGRGGGSMEWRTPPEGYTCHRCQVPGHYIHHCPTNGDPHYDVKKLKKPTGIPKSMLLETTDGSYALLGGSVAVLEPSDAAFEKLVEGIPSSISKRVIDVPPELHCPMCKQVMRFAVLTSKCCFQSFCDGCIRGNIMSKSMCICGARGILVDDLIPNRTIRETIDRYMESGNTSSGDTKSTITAEPKIPSPSPSCASKVEKRLSCPKEEILEVNKVVKEENCVGLLQQALEKGKSAPNLDLSEDVQNSAALEQEEVQQKDQKDIFTVDGQPLPADDLFWGTSQATGANYCMMPFGTSAYNNNSYWSNMQGGMGGCMDPYIGYMGYAAGPYGGMFSQNQNLFGGGPGYAMPCAPSQTKKRSRVAPCRGSDWSHDDEDDEERNYKRKQSWYGSSVSCSAK
ncbi:hypothetical protein MKW94_001850 [Papaver nudicaule]|uniref:Zinc knuckle CX2CX3GHX4C domain-containing protein n=1 Tax=Papaver nudicaule TaxID=74823 RepID=A0AA41UY48_PAPNU|nr:hypothetical protein [Papaver nudicaule]